MRDFSNNSINFLHKPLQSIVIIIITCILSYWIFYWALRLTLICIFTPNYVMKNGFYRNQIDLTDFVYQTISYPYIKPVTEI